MLFPESAAMGAMGEASTAGAAFNAAGKLDQVTEGLDLEGSGPEPAE